MKLIAQDIFLRFVEISDAPFIYMLRTHSGRSKYLHAVASGVDSQVEWIKDYKEREARRQDFYFIVLTRNQESVGAVRVYDLQPDSFCWGSWIVTPDAPMYAAIESAMAMYDLGFYHLGYKKAHLDVRKDNTKVVNFHKRFGAEYVREDEQNFYMTFSLTDYENTVKKYHKFYQQIKVEE